MSEEKKNPESQPKPKQAKASKSKHWTKKLFIPGYGLVLEGEEATKEALKAWDAWTKESKDNYLK